MRPGLDDKVLLGWNALFLRSLVEAAHALHRDDWMDAARANADFLLRELRRDDGRLLRSWQDGRANLLAYAEDYAALLEALLTLAELDDVRWLAEARTVADGLVTLFADDERGGFFTTGADAEALIVRPKDFQDNATPSENSLAADGLLRLAGAHRRTPTAPSGRSGGSRAWPPSSASTPRRSRSSSRRSSVSSGRRSRSPSSATRAPARDALVDVVRTRVLPGAVRVTAAPGVGADLTPLLADRALVDGQPAAYVCERFACRLPVTEPEALRAELDGRR